MTLFYIEFGSPTTRRCAPLKCTAPAPAIVTPLSTVACPPVHRGEAARGTPPRTHGTSWLIIHVQLKVSAPFECGALHRASSVVHREVVHTLGSDSFCGRWLIPGPQATSLGSAAAGPYQSASSRELRGLQGDHQNEYSAQPDASWSAHRCVQCVLGLILSS